MGGVINFRRIKGSVLLPLAISSSKNYHVPDCGDTSEQYLDLNVQTSTALKRQFFKLAFTDTEKSPAAQF